MRPAFLPVMIGLMAIGPAATGPGSAVAETIDNASRYKTCMATVWRDPASTYESGLAWAGLGGGDLAERCIAVALFAMKQYDKSAIRLETVATQSTGATAYDRAGMLAQASQGWLMAGNTQRALGAIDAAIALVPDTTALSVDRGRVLALLGREREALAAFNLYLRDHLHDADALVYRGAVLRKLGDFPAARRDLDQALQLRPDHPEALLERGLVARGQGEIAAARADLIAAVQAAPTSPTARAAQRYIEAIDGPSARR